MTRHIDPVTLAKLAAEGLSDRELGDVFGCHERTILRRRKALGIPSQWTPPVSAHGTMTRYANGCRCAACRRQNAAVARAWRATKQAASASAQRHGEPWTEAEDVVLVLLGPAVACSRLDRTFHGCAQRLNRLRRAA